MDKLSTAMQAFVDAEGLGHTDGLTDTKLQGVSFYHSRHSSARRPLLYQSGIIIMGQGHKSIHLSEHNVKYSAGDYLVIGVPLPLECEAIADDGKPLLSLCIDVDLPLLRTLVKELNINKLKPIDKPKNNCGLQLCKLDNTIEDSCIRLLNCLLDETDMRVLGKDIVKEIIYRVLNGPQADTLIGLVQQESHYAKIAQVLDAVHANVANPITVESLSQEANMSVSSFHRAFKEVTMESPIQYIKKLRLAKAKDLIQLEGKRSSDAANLVGYSSKSQFFREFKRRYNHSPSQVIFD
ncbi:AraC family transcriptional regulator [Photobacterium minamisatsumaniensis]|uniref:AraC family transcriptional regulator n=1 Tax=Photobacterium minamisatsumaniensis TaxID=2910233 RepID=UPI003D13623E